MTGPGVRAGSTAGHESSRIRLLDMSDLDILQMLQRRLDFIARFYEQATAPFERIKFLIAGEDEPYPRVRDSEKGDRYGFSEERRFLFPGFMPFVVPH